MRRATKEVSFIIGGLALFFAFAAWFSVAHAGDLPDPALTPGAIDPEVVDSSLTIEQLCNESTKARRHVTAKQKAETYAAYGLHQEHRPDCTGPGNACYEIDHDCSLELGCNNVAKNRWPQLYDGPNNAHDKDLLENRLHKLVCSGVMTLKAAQACISTNWIECAAKVMQ